MARISVPIEGHRTRGYVGQIAGLFDEGGAQTQLRVVMALGTIGGREAIDAMRTCSKKKGLSPSLQSTLDMALRTAERRLHEENG